jgi:hypothetical protein
LRLSRGDGLHSGREVLAEMPLGPGTRLTIRVKGPEEEHKVTVAKVLSWL